MKLIVKNFALKFIPIAIRLNNLLNLPRFIINVKINFYCFIKFIIINFQHNLIIITFPVIKTPHLMILKDN